MKYLLDTDPISILQHRTAPEFAVLSARIAQQSQADLAFCVVSFHEQLLGCHTFLNKAKTIKDTIRGYDLLEEVRQGFTASLCYRLIPPLELCSTICESKKFALELWIYELPLLHYPRISHSSLVTSATLPKYQISLRKIGPLSPWPLTSSSDNKMNYCS